jgi:hypothetical protein
MRRIAAIITSLALAVALVAAPRIASEAGAEASPPDSKAFGKTLTEWMQLYFTSYYSGGGCPARPCPPEDHVGQVKFLPLPVGEQIGGSGTYADPAVLEGHLNVTLRPGTPFVLPVTVWVGERYEDYPVVPDDPALPADLFTDPSKNLITVSIDGKPVMNSRVASVSPFYFGPAPLGPEGEGVIYEEPSSYGSIAAIFVQGIGFVHPPLSVGTHTIELVSELRIPPELLNSPVGLGIRYENTWTITVSPE